MKRLLISCAFALPLVALTAGPAMAEVKSKEKTQIQLEGLLGTAARMFGGKAAKEGVVSTNAVKGNRKATMSDTSGRIVDLTEEKVYEIDLKSKSYTVKTFAQIREELRKARERAEQEAQKNPGQTEKPEAGKPAKEVEVDFDVKETGQKKSIAGYDARQVIMTVTVREKGLSLEDGGGVVMTADSWLGPDIPALKEVGEFELRYWKQLQGSEIVTGMSPDQMALVLAQQPMIKNAAERLRKEGDKLKGTPLTTITTFEAVKSKDQMIEQQAQQQQSGNSGGLGGMLARKMMKQNGEVKPRATIFTATTEVQEISTTVSAADLDIPAGFKEKK